MKERRVHEGESGGRNMSEHRTNRSNSTELGMFRIAIDTGGTFTDVVALNETTGETYVTKTPSTPHDPSQAVLDGTRKIIDQMRVRNDSVSAVVHGTTVATNALLEERFDHLGLITTRGFRDILEIARQSVPSSYGNAYFWVKPERIVPLERVKEVSERMNFRGEVIRPFDEEEAVAVARWFRKRGITSIGICFLHSYANPQHERQMRDVLQREFPEASVSISSDILLEYREYERTVTTVVDAFVKPQVGEYIRRIQSLLHRNVGQMPFYIMKSNGGVCSATEAAEHPSNTLLSGPAAGVIGAAYLCQRADIDKILTLDVGGTSTDVALIEAAGPQLTTEGTVGRFPVKVPMLDIVTIGTGGGSIAWRAADGKLKVGPRSAGASPGPMCYDRGGQEPTVTDANLFLGRIPTGLLGGEVALKVELSEAGISRLAGEVGLTPHAMAAGILEIAAWNQANAIRQVSIRRGRDPREYTLVAFGGAGPLLAGQLLDILDLKAALVPLAPGNVSAMGLTCVDLRNDYSRTKVQRHDAVDLEETEAILSRLEERAREALRREGFTDAEMTFQRTADLRYLGQAWEVRVDLPDGPLDAEKAEESVERFHTAHQQIFGYSYREAQGPGAPRQGVEWVNLRVTGIGPVKRPILREVRLGNGAAPVGRRPVFFSGGFVDCPIYSRAALGADDRVQGPAIIEEYGSTTVVFPRQTARVDQLGNLILERV